MAGERNADLPAVHVAAEHQVPVVRVQQLAALGAVGQQEHGVLMSTARSSMSLLLCRSLMKAMRRNPASGRVSAGGSVVLHSNCEAPFVERKIRPTCVVADKTW